MSVGYGLVAKVVVHLPMDIWESMSMANGKESTQPRLVGKYFIIKGNLRELVSVTLAITLHVLDPTTYI
jgi:hypothetical protein